MVPNTVVKKEIFKPAASIPEEILPMLSIASKAVIKPIIEPKNPKTNPNKLISEAKFVIFIDCKVSFFKHKKARIIRNKANKKQININDIKSGPPSMKRSTNTLDTKKVDKKYIEIFIINSFNLTYSKTSPFMQATR